MNGIIVIDKPKGYTSHDVVNVLRKELNIKKIGHTGTLDPNATGVLPVLVGQATKVSKYLIEHNKEYIAKLSLGKRSTTGDIEGEIIEEKEVPKLQEKEVQKILKTFLGKQMQIPPIYSSIKINGKKAYEYAREGKNITLEPRPIDIMEIEPMELEENYIIFRVKCSKGTYIRVLCEDIAKKLGTVGLMQELKRTKVNDFKIEDAITIEEIKEKGKEFVKQKIHTIENAFKEFEKINLNKKDIELLLNGVKLPQEKKEGTYKIYCENEFLGLGIVKEKLLKRDVVIESIDF